jgi:uncharacterized membrane protein
MKFSHTMTFEKIMMRVLASWFAVNFFVKIGSVAIFTYKDYKQESSFLVFALETIAVFFAITVIDFSFPVIRVDGFAFLFFSLAYSFSLLPQALSSPVVNEYYFAIALLAFLAVALYYVLRNDLLNVSVNELKLNNKVTVFIVVALGVAFAIFVSLITVCRYLSFYAPNFDFGIFVNMFHNMRTKFFPYVTSERNLLLSHFAVHISPIYYLMLPFYLLFPYPQTLQILQAVVLASGIVPLYLLAKHKRLSNKTIVFLSFLYALYPALSSGCYYDLHENCFLTALLFWTFYFYEKKKYIPLYIFAFLVLLVKEDASIYIAFFAFYIILSNLSKKNYKASLHGCGLFLLAAAYFAFSWFVMSKYGEGIMDKSRYGNYIPDDGNIINMVKTVFINPGYVFTQLLTAEKLIYVFKMLLPLAFLPVMTKKVSRLTLFLPLILMSLMTNYGYQFNLRFQYQFGVLAFLFYMTLLNISEMEGFNKRFVLSFAVVATTMIFGLNSLPDSNVIRHYVNDKVIYSKMNEALKQIPPDASVKSTTFILAHIANRNEIYAIDYEAYHNTDIVHNTDYIVLDMRGGADAEDSIIARDYINYALQNGYNLLFEEKGLIIILIRGDLTAYRWAEILKIPC